jgi:hypothetical protein
LHLPKSEQYVILAWKVVEKRALTNVCCFGNVSDRRLVKPFFGKEIEGGTEQALTGLHGSTLATAVQLSRWRS